MCQCRQCNTTPEEEAAFYAEKDLAAEYGPAYLFERSEVEILRDLVQTLIDNDPFEPISDGGHVASYFSRAATVFQPLLILTGHLG